MSKLSPPPWPARGAPWSRTAAMPRLPACTWALRASPTRQLLLRSTRPVLPPHYLGEEVDSERSGTPPSAAQLASGAGGIRVTQTGQRLRRLPLLVSCSSSRGSHRHAEQVSGDSVLACLTPTAQPPAPSASSRPGALSAILSQKPRRAAEAASTCAWVTQPAQVWTMPRGARLRPPSALGRLESPLGASPPSLPRTR